MKTAFNKHKTHLIYSFNLNSRKLFVSLFMIATIITTNLVYRYAEGNIQPVVTSLAVSQANTYASELINNTVTKVAESGIDYSDLCKINKDEKGEILSINTNTQKINKIKQQTASVLISLINNTSYEDVEIPIGSITKSHFMSGRGLKIPIRLLITGSPKMEIDNKFESAGINQTKHKISIITTVEIEVILPYDNVKTTVSSETMLCETVIVGKIPNVYVSK